MVRFDEPTPTLIYDNNILTILLSDTIQPRLFRNANRKEITKMDKLAYLLNAQDLESFHHTKLDSGDRDLMPCETWD